MGAAGSQANTLQCQQRCYKYDEECVYFNFDAATFTNKQLYKKKMLSCLIMHNANSIPPIQKHNDKALPWNKTMSWYNDYSLSSPKMLSL